VAGEKGSHFIAASMRQDSSFFESSGGWKAVAIDD
jgi:hypothetical protein